MLSVFIRLLILFALLALVKPPRLLTPLGAPQTVQTRRPIAAMHTRFTEEAEEWKIKRGLQMLREMGVTTIVEFFPWAYYEPSKGQFDWRSAERVIAHANQQGLRVIARLGLPPAWAQTKRKDCRLQNTDCQVSPTYLPNEAYVDFAEFAAAFAAHFRGRVGQVILWNEPNLSNEWGLRPVDAAGYAELVMLAYPMIKHANPDVGVLIGALAPTLEPIGSAQGLDDLIYLEQFYEKLKLEKEKLKKASNSPFSIFHFPFYDGIAVHAYGRSAPPDEPPARDRINYRRTELVRELMLQNGDADLPILITEAGWNDDPNWVFGVTPAQRIRYTLEAWDYAQTHWPYVQSVAMWVFKEPRPARGYRDHFTFVTPSLEPLPIYDEVKQANQNIPLK